MILKLLLLLSFSSFTTCLHVSTTGSTTRNRRGFLLDGAATFIAPAILSFSSAAIMVKPLPAQAAINKDVELVQETEIQLKSLCDQIDKYYNGLLIVEGGNIPEDTPKLPAQVPFRVFQGLTSKAKDLPDLNFDSSDFIGIAAEYAEHAGSARDYTKLARLGRTGENGSEDVVIFYAKKAVEELKEAEILLQVLAKSVK